MQSVVKKGKKKTNRSLFYRICAWLHLWLGFVTGLVMMVVCLTGCIWMFNDEITAFLEPETKIEARQQPVLPPSRLRAIAAASFPGQPVSYASYQQGRAVFIGIGQGRKLKAMMRVNPYTGEVVQVKELKEGETEFFRMILNGHRFLWLPPGIGRPIINYSTLIFVLILLTGMVMWWPRKWTKAARDQGFKIKWKASFKRVNYDLHNVLGFYSLLVLAVIALTGMVYGIEWYSKGLYWVSSGGKALGEFRSPKSDSTQAGKYYSGALAMDAAWEKVVSRNQESQGFYYSFPDSAKPAAPISIYVYPSVGQFYNRKTYFFDQHTLKELKGNKVFEGPYETASGADKLRRMNYDLHIGSVWGLPGRILAFMASLIGASLPVTGALVWWGKQKKVRKTGKKAPKVIRKAAALAG
jgi:uncharacterized iron-regulated membrane protein